MAYSWAKCLEGLMASLKSQGDDKDSKKRNWICGSCPAESISESKYSGLRCKMLKMWWNSFYF